MAVTKIEAVKANLNEGISPTFTAASSAEDGFVLDARTADNKTVYLFNGAGTVTFKAGDAIQGVSDVEVTTVAAGTVVRIDSGRFKMTTGENAGFITVIPSGTGIKAAVVELP